MCFKQNIYLGPIKKKIDYVVSDFLEISLANSRLRRVNGPVNGPSAGGFAGGQLSKPGGRGGCLVSTPLLS